MTKKQTKRSVKNQKYENYWKLTMEYTDIFGDNFIQTLRIIIDFMDEHELTNNKMSRKEFQSLTALIEETFPKSDSASTRKSINQFYKLGFLNNNGHGYHELTKKFLNESNANQKVNIMSKIMYDNASFSRSYSRPSKVNEVNFFIKTLENLPNQKMDLNQLKGLMTVNIEDYPNGFIPNHMLDQVSRNAVSSGFADRKFNQIGYTQTMFTKLEGVYHHNNVFSLSEHIIEEIERKVRDPYLQSLYKTNLVKESKDIYGDVICFVEKLPHKSLIASHIKPFIVCEEHEEYDENNGLLLSRNIDALFDYGYITFDNRGQIIFSDMLDDKLVEALSSFSLDPEIYNDKRKEYMIYHRENEFNKLKK